MKNLLKILFLLFPLTVFGLNNQNAIIGTVQSIKLQPNEDYPIIAQRYDVGYYELYEANPGVDPDSPIAGTILIIPTRYILPPELHYNVVINLAEMRLYYESVNPHKIYIFPIGIGKEGWNTPTGIFAIIAKTKNPSWTAPDDVYRYRIAHGEKIARVIPPGKDNPLGQYALRLSNPSYLIHGTDDPVGVGRRSSAGCIRMYPEDIKKLFSMVNIGTEVQIINAPYKATQINNEIYLEAHMPLYEQRVVMRDDVSLATNTVKKAIAKSNTTSVDWKKVETVAKNHLGVPQLVSTQSNTTTTIPYNNTKNQTLPFEKSQDSNVIPAKEEPTPTTDINPMTIINQPESLEKRLEILLNQDVICYSKSR